MKFRDFADNLLGSKVKIKILRIVLSEETVTSERELAKIIGISHGAVNKAMKDFQDLNLVIPLRIGNSIAWQVNKDSFAYLYTNKSIFLPIDQLKTIIKIKLGHIGSVKKVVIYGSVAEGRELPSSDIDLFILVEKDENKRSILSSINDLSIECTRLFGNKISPNIFTEKDAKSKRNQRLMENISRGIVVFERED